MSHCTAPENLREPSNSEPVARPLSEANVGAAEIIVCRLPQNDCACSIAGASKTKQPSSDLGMRPLRTDRQFRTFDLISSLRNSWIVRSSLVGRQRNPRSATSREGYFEQE